jgi:glyoxylase-like metal-dependent hydrolase (beta-lactamase superfamily II)
MRESHQTIVMNEVKQIAPEVIRIPVSIGNCYLVGTRGQWVLVDSGPEGHAKQIRKVAEEYFGPDARPEAIVLTHGHFDHAGSAGALSKHWGVSIYAHRLEMPYLTGKSKYPPPDPTVGGFMAQMIRFFPNKAYNYGKRARKLSGSLSAIGMPDWKMIETPGHSPGHVSFFRERDGVLLAGDAFATVDQTSAKKMMKMRPEISLPPTYYTCDWDAAQRSVKALADLEPRIIGAGHGEPMSGNSATAGLHRLAHQWPAPERGRYVDHPAVADEDGVKHLPPPAPDPVKWVGLGIAGAAVGAGALWKRKRASRAHVTVDERAA